MGKSDERWVKAGEVGGRWRKVEGRREKVGDMSEKVREDGERGNDG